MTIIDNTAAVLANLGLIANKISTPPGYAGLQVDLPNNSQAYFVWSKIDAQDFHFRLARFWENDNPFSMVVCSSLPEAITQTLVFVKK
jgi:hypothetical protein